MKKVITISLCFLAIILTVIGIIYYFIEPSILIKSMKGELVMNNSLNNLNNDGITIFSPKTGKFTFLFKGSFYNAVYDQEKANIFAIEVTKLNQENEFAIYEYNIKEKRLSPLVKCYGSNTSNYGTVKYIPNKKSISYTWQDDLYMYNLETKSEYELTEIDGDENYSWSSDGSYFLYNKDNDDMIYKYNVLTNSTETVCKGKSPELSHNSRYLAYKSESNILKVRDLENGTEWQYDAGIFIDYFRFSPDDSNIAVAQGTKNFFNVIPPVRIKVWNFKSDKVNRLIWEDYYGSEFDWD